MHLCIVRHRLVDQSEEVVVAPAALAQTVEPLRPKIAIKSVSALKRSHRETINPQSALHDSHNKFAWWKYFSPIDELHEWFSPMWKFLASPTKWKQKQNKKQQNSIRKQLNKNYWDNLNLEFTKESKKKHKRVERKVRCCPPKMCLSSSFIAAALRIGYIQPPKIKTIVIKWFQRVDSIQSWLNSNQSDFASTLNRLFVVTPPV